MRCLLMATNGALSLWGGEALDVAWLMQSLRCCDCSSATAPACNCLFNVAYTKVVALNAQWPSPSPNSGSDSYSEYDSDGPARVRRRRRWLAKCGLSSCCVRVGRTQQRPASKTPTWQLAIWQLATAFKLNLN